MNIPKKDLMITYHTENCYGVSVRKKFIYIFNHWVPFTYQESENSKELPIEFKTFEDASEFINTISI